MSEGHGNKTEDQNLNYNDCYHVYPKEDLKEHVLDGLKCWCKPRLSDGSVILHNSMDGRERHENGAKKH